MRKITFSAVVVFLCLVTVAGSLAFLSAYLPYRYFASLPVFFTVAGIFGFYLYAVLIYRLFLKRFPLEEGYIPPGSQQELVYHIYLLFYLVLFYQLIRPKIIPVPLLKLVYLLLGARLGKNTFCSGTILDPIFTHAGDNTIIGEDSCLFAHAIEGSHLSHRRIVLGSHVTIGAKAVLMSGVAVEDHAIVAAGSVVPKNTCIKTYEIWGGNPARFIKSGKPDHSR